MLITILVLGSAALLAGSLFENSDDQDDDLDNQLEKVEVEDLPGEMIFTNNVIDADAIVSVDHYFPIESHDDINRLDAEALDVPTSDPSEVTDLVQNGCADSLPDTIAHSSLIIDTDMLESAALPLSDWVSNSGVVKIELPESEVVSVDVQTEEGSLHILRADYFERTDSEMTGGLDIIHAGANIYFVPFGEEFPEDYIWSESGASLYNPESSENSPEVFGNIKFVSRVDSGLMYGDAAGEEALEFQQRAFAELQEKFTSNGEFKFWL